MHVFVDTAAWLALLNTSDGLHSQAQQIMRQMRQQNVGLVTTEFVLLEVANSFATPPGRARTVTFINGLRSLAVLEIVPASQNLLLDGWTLYRQRPDKAWGLTECISFVVMTQRRITHAFTSDHHFEQAGFQRMLSP